MKLKDFKEWFANLPAEMDEADIYFIDVSASDGVDTLEVNFDEDKKVVCISGSW